MALNFDYKSIISKRPPLNLFEVKRATIATPNEDKTIYCARNFVIPQSGFTKERIVETATIITGLIITNTGSVNQTIKATVKIRGLKEGTVGSETREDYIIIKDVPIEPHDFASISLDRQVMKSSAENVKIDVANIDDINYKKLGEELIIKIDSGSVDVHFSYIVNQREELTVEQ